MKHCCSRMEYYLNFTCKTHLDAFECPDAILVYDEIFDEYGLIVHDGGRSTIEIDYCPWCGQKLPESKRERWFKELEDLGLDSPSEQQIPPKYRTSEWWRK